MNREFAFPVRAPATRPIASSTSSTSRSCSRSTRRSATVAGTATLRGDGDRAAARRRRARCRRADDREGRPSAASRRRSATTARSCASSCRRRSPPAPSSTIAIDYKGAPRRGLYFIAPDDGYPDKPVQAWTQGQDEDSRYWFPCFDAPNEKATSEVTVTVPGDHVRAVERRAGRPTRPSGDKRTLHWRLDVPHSCYLSRSRSATSATIETKWRDVPVVYYVRARPRGRGASARSRARRRCSSCSREQFGVPYPYPRYAQVFVADFIFGGMENTSATTLTDTVLLDERAAIDYDVDALVAHELAHQWFGDLVTCRDWGEGWLNEGFATYSEYIWREHHEGRDAADLELEEWARRVLRRGRGPLPPHDRDEALRRADRHLRSPPLREGRPRAAHAAQRARRRGVLQGARALPRQAPPRARRVARPRARGRGRDRQDRRLVLQPVGDRRRRPSRARRRASSWDPDTSIATITRRADAEGRRAHAAVPAADEDAVPDRRRRDVDVPIEIIEPEAGVPPAARRRADAGDLRSRPRAARRAHGSTSRSRLDRRARGRDARDRSRCGRAGARASAAAPAAEQALLGSALEKDKFWAVRGDRGARARHAAHAGRRATADQAAQGRGASARAPRDRARARRLRPRRRRPAPRSRRSSTRATRATSSRPRRASRSVARARRAPASCSAQGGDPRLVHRRHPPARVSRARRGARRQRARPARRWHAWGRRRKAGAPPPVRSRCSCAAAAIARRATCASGSSSCSPTRTFASRPPRSRRSASSAIRAAIPCAAPADRSRARRPAAPPRQRVDARPRRGRTARRGRTPPARRGRRAALAARSDARADRGARGEGRAGRSPDEAHACTATEEANSQAPLTLRRAHPLAPVRSRAPNSESTSQARRTA